MSNFEGDSEEVQKAMHFTADEGDSGQHVDIEMQDLSSPTDQQLQPDIESDDDDTDSDSEEEDLKSKPRILKTNKEPSLVEIL